MTEQKKQLAYVVCPGTTLLDLVATFSVLKGPMSTSHESFTVAESTHPIRTDTVVDLVPDKTFNDAPHPNWLVVTGAGISTLKALGDEVLRDYVRSAAEHAELVIGISTGALLLAGLGLMEGRKATTHRAYGGLLPKLGTEYVEKQWVEDGKFVTCAGGTAGLELALCLVAKCRSESLARQQQLFAEYDPQPPFGGVEWGKADRDVVWTTLTHHQADLEAALVNHPDLYHKLFPNEAIDSSRVPLES